MRLTELSWVEESNTPKASITEWWLVTNDGLARFFESVTGCGKASFRVAVFPTAVEAASDNKPVVAAVNRCAAQNQEPVFRSSFTVLRISRESASSDTARASTIAPTSALKVKIAFDPAALLSLPGSKSASN